MVAAQLWFTLEVALALYAAIVLACLAKRATRATGATGLQGPQSMRSIDVTCHIL